MPTCKMSCRSRARLRVERAAELQTKPTDRITRLLKRRAKLHGLDKPVQADMTVTQQDEQDQELQQILREAKATQSAAEQQIRETQ